MTDNDPDGIRITNRKAGGLLAGWLLLGAVALAAATMQLPNADDPPNGSADAAASVSGVNERVAIMTSGGHQTVEFRFALNQVVKVVASGRDATVCGLWIDRDSIQWCRMQTVLTTGQVDESWVRECDLEEMPDGNSDGQCRDPAAIEPTAGTQPRDGGQTCCLDGDACGVPTAPTDQAAIDGVDVAQPGVE